MRRAGTSVPNLKLHDFVIDGDVPDLEIHTDGADEGLLKHVILRAWKPSALEDRDAPTSHLDPKGGYRKSEKQRRLAHTAVAHEQNLEQMIAA